MMTDSIRTLETLEIVGGALCLDFVNTINSRVNPEHDYLMYYSDLAGWANKVGILPSSHANQLYERANQNIEEADEALKAARDLRELLYRIFSKLVNGSNPKKEDMVSFVRYYGESISQGQFFKTEKHYMTVWRFDQALDALLLPIIHSAGELLQSDDLPHVKECPGCGWLFLDTSKNQSRRWCSMNTCGARDKMRRYHKRKQAK